MYTYEEALSASIEYFGNEELPGKVFVDKYALRDADGNILESTPSAMHERLAREFARIDAEKYGLNFEERFDLYFTAMDKFARIVPQGSPMSALGNTHQVMSASNCVVVTPPEDNVKDIFRAGLALAQLYKRRCGVGTDLSRLRPDGFRVNNAARTTTGAWSFADFYSFITRMIGQNSRRGALMLTLNVHHPDVIKFATMKADLTKVTGANISIRLSNEFLQAVEDDTEYEQRWPCEDGKEPVYKNLVRARDVWDVIVETATKTAEPGLIFWDTMGDYLPAHEYSQFKLSSTNPCSEIGLSNMDSCRLISINLTGYVRNAFAPNASFDFAAYRRDIALAMQMIDNLVDLEIELIGKIIAKIKSEGSASIDIRALLEGKVEESVIEAITNQLDTDELEMWKKFIKSGHDGRRTGLGTHGLADTLAQLRIKYDSEKALEVVDTIYSTLRDTAYGASIELAKVRGPFPAWDWEVEKDNKFLKNLPTHLYEEMAKHGRRNISILCQAPTGSVSMLSKVGEFDKWNVSSGVEPVFMNFYTRRKKINPNDANTRVDYTDSLGDSWQEFKVYHNNVKAYVEKTGNETLPNFFVTSDAIDWEYRVRLQGVEQTYIDHSISSTLNLPKGTSSETVGGIYLQAWKQGLKGVTVYVDGSRDGVLVTENSKKGVEVVEAEVNVESVIDFISSDISEEDVGRLIKPAKLFIEKYTTNAPRRPKCLPSETHKVKIDSGEGPRNAYITVSFFEGSPYEVLIVTPHSGLTDKDQQVLELTARMTSTSLRHGIPLPFICEQLDKIGGQYLYSVPTSIAKVLRSYIDFSKEEELIEVPEETIASEPVSGPKLVYTKCPHCHKRTYRVTGQACGICDSCGYSGCS